jgi:hypothetical protein
LEVLIRVLDKVLILLRLAPDAVRALDQLLDVSIANAHEEQRLRKLRHAKPRPVRASLAPSE